MADDKNKPATSGEISLGRVALSANQQKNLTNFKDDRISKAEFRNGELIVTPTAKKPLSQVDRDNLRSAIVSNVPDTAPEDLEDESNNR